MAVRGCEKRIYHVKNTESELFDEAYFILKVGGKSHASGPRELEREAMRLVRGAAKPSESKVGADKREKIMAFVFGSLFTCVTIGAVGLIIWLVL